MKTFARPRSAVWLLVLTSALISTAEGANFDSCVNNLYAFGGISKAEARQSCVRGLSDEVISCQHKKFLVDFLNPIEALKSCQSNLEKTHYRNFQVYQGHYEKLPEPGPKKTVCTITVNSKDEREAFRSELNPNEYNIVELLPQNPPGFADRFIPRDDVWLKKACQQKVRCDIVVISGHFASQFLGDSGFEVKLEDLTRASCQDDCKDFFESVQQVYLFGCNTLSQKEPDKRTIGQYRDILTEDGVSAHHSQRIAARRYTSYGQSIQDEIKKVFPKASQIFGFIGPGPTGPSIRKTLKTYLKTAYDGKSSREELKDNFVKTLGRTGMKVVAGEAQTEKSCEFPQKNIFQPQLATVPGLQKFIQQHAAELPVAAVDLIYEAHQMKAIDSSTAQQLTQQVLQQFSNMNRPNQRHRLCPLLIANYKEIVPSSLNCATDTSWL